MPSPKYLVPLEVPLTPDGKVDGVNLESVVNEFVDSGNHSIIVNSRMAKTQFSTYEGRKKAIELVSGYVNAKKSDVLVVVDVTRGGNDCDFERMSSVVRAEARRAEQAGAQYLLICPFYYSFMSNNNIEEHLPLVFESANKPVILSNNPEMHHGEETGCIDPERIRDLEWPSHNNKRVYGVVDNSGDSDYRRTLSHMTDMPRDFKIFKLRSPET